jgi:hypothetical protein
MHVAHPSFWQWLGLITPSSDSSARSCLRLPISLIPGQFNTLLPPTYELRPAQRIHLSSRSEIPSFCS